jgi:hypothetical protein
MSVDACGKGTTITLFANRSFLIWNMTIPAGKTFEISDWIGNELIHRGVCITVADREKKIEEKKKRKAEKASADSTKEIESAPKRGRKAKEPE